MDERDERAAGPPDAAPTGDDPPARGREGVRIAAVEAAVAAGLVPSTSPCEPRRPAPAAAEGEAAGRRSAAEEQAEDVELGIQLPDWSDPPTGQVPRIVLGLTDGDPLAPVDVSLPGPAWREDPADWEQEVDLSFLADDEVRLEAADDDEEERAWAALLGAGGGVGPDPTSPDGGTSPADGERGRPGRRRAKSGRHSAGGRRQRGSKVHGEAPAGPSAREHGAEPLRPGGRGDGAREAVAQPAPTPAGGRRSASVATATGLAFGALAVLCFLGGPYWTLALVAAVVTLAAGEAFATLRKSGLRPATLVGLLAVPCLAVLAYLHGSAGQAGVLAGAVMVSFAWFLLTSGPRADGRRRVLADLGATLAVIFWVGLLGSFGGRLLDQRAFPHRHGLAYLLAVVAVTVAADVGAYATGAKLGRHALAPKVSPNKSIEGVLGGSVLAMLVAGLVLPHIHPISSTQALWLGLIVVVLAPIGDLAESLLKRDLGVKDMGSTLPAHGGVLDRIDAMLFVLPAAFLLFSSVHP